MVYTFVLIFVDILFNIVYKITSFCLLGDIFMDKNTIINILTDWNFWGKQPDAGIERPLYTKRLKTLLSTGQIVAITGPRRAGKSYIMRQFARHMIKNGTPPQNILIINLEDPRFETPDTGLLQNIYETYLQVHNPSEKPYILLDEVHEVPNWEKWVAMMGELSKANIILTGSNAKLLSRELSTLLTGRHVTMNVWPLSFAEVLQFNNIKANSEIELNNNKIEIKRCLDAYFEYGAFPKVVLAGEKRDILLNYYDDIIGKDLIGRFEIRKTSDLKSLARFYISNTASPITYNSAEKFLKLSVATIEKFSSYLEEVYLFHFVKRFSPKVKEQEKSPRKVYPVDSGLANIVGFSLSQNIGRIAEQIVFLELERRRSFYRDSEIFYWKDIQHKEVDFVIKEGDSVNSLIQVCWDPSMPETKKREMSALVKAMAEFKLNEGIVITGEYEGSEKIDGNVIKFIPLWRWLL